MKINFRILKVISPVIQIQYYETKIEKRERTNRWKRIKQGEMEKDKGRSNNVKVIREFIMILYVVII